MSVYFAEAGPYMKIGYSADPTQRISTITRTGARPADLPKKSEAELIGWVPGGRRREAALHRQFAHVWVEGEWFWSERQAVVDLIWADPRGVDIHGMSAMAAIAMLDHPILTRDQVEACGVPIKAISQAEGLARLSERLGSIVGRVA